MGTQLLTLKSLRKNIYVGAGPDDSGLPPVVDTEFPRFYISKGELYQASYGETTYFNFYLEGDELVLEYDDSFPEPNLRLDGRYLVLEE